MRREQRKKAARRSNLITIAIAVVIVGAVTYFIISERAKDVAVTKAPKGVAAQQAGCDEIEEHGIEGRNHVEEDVQYEITPPTSGNHAETPADAGFYPTAVPEEPLVHNLEHGQIVIWYRPDASSETIDDLEAFVESANDPDDPDVKRFGTQPLLAAPHTHVVEPRSYVLAAWGASQACESYSLEAINEFRTRYQGRGPEQVAPPFDG